LLERGLNRGPCHGGWTAPQAVLQAGAGAAQAEARAREDAERAMAATKKWLHQTQGELMNAQGALIVKARPPRAPPPGPARRTARPAALASLRCADTRLRLLPHLLPHGACCAVSSVPACARGWSRLLWAVSVHWRGERVPRCCRPHELLEQRKLRQVPAASGGRRTTRARVGAAQEQACKELLDRLRAANAVIAALKARRVAPLPVPFLHTLLAPAPFCVACISQVSSARAAVQSFS